MASREPLSERIRGADPLRTHFARVDQFLHWLVLGPIFPPIGKLAAFSLSPVEAVPLERAQAAVRITLMGGGTHDFSELNSP